MSHTVFGDMWTEGSKNGVNNTEASGLADGSGWCRCRLHTSPSVAAKQCPNTEYLSLTPIKTAVDVLMVTTHCAAGLWLLRHSSDLTGRRRSSRPPAPQPDGTLSACDVPRREVCILGVQPTKVPQLADETTSTWSEISEDRSPVLPDLSRDK